MGASFLSDQIVVIGGAAGGLGMHLTSHFAQLGARVVALDKSSPTDPTSAGITWLPCDLAMPDSVERAVAEIKKFGRCVELLVNAAGVFVPDPPFSETASALEVLWRGNLAATVLPTLALQDLLGTGARPLVVNIASVDAIVASAGQDCEIGVSHDVLYATSKGAVVSFTRALAMRWAPMGIRVNAICPSIFESPMTEALLQSTGKKQQLMRHIPLGRLCTTDDIVRAVEALYALEMTTGHVLPVDGGYLCT